MADEQHSFYSAIGLARGASGENVQALQDYLQRFGYLSGPGVHDDAYSAVREEIRAQRAVRAQLPMRGVFDEATVRALRDFQEFHGLPVTGKLDAATAAQIGKPRCGFPDRPRIDRSRTVSARFQAQGNRWNTPNLTYGFGNFTADLGQQQIQDGIRAAFDLWSAVTSLTFQEIPAGNNPDIVIRFVAGDHGDGTTNAFDGAGGVLAHAFYPPPNGGAIAGDAHFDEAETWSVNLPVPLNSFDLVTVAAHEFGHSLGLDHSDVPGALMWPAYGGPQRFLSTDDVAGIQSLYGCLTWGLVSNTGGFGQVWDGRPIWIGNFSRPDRAEVLFYFPGDGNWWLGSFDGNQLNWTFAGNTSGFGQVWDGRPFWIGDFNGDGRADVLFYFPGDGNWWLGSHDGNRLVWTFVGNTLGFGQVWDGRPFWIGNFSRADRAEVLFYFPGDGNWWLGSHNGNQLNWTFAGNTLGFGQVWDGRPFWVGDFNGDGRADILFYYPGDGNWWLGSHDGNQISWTFAGNTLGFGQVWDGRPFWIGNFSRSDRAQVLFYFPGDGNWWLGSHDGSSIAWTFAGNTLGFGDVWDGRPFWVGDFTGNGRADLIFYYPGDGNWWLGAHDGNHLQWRFAGNTMNFGQVGDGRPIWAGDFNGDGRTDVLFYFPGDGNWWLGRSGAL